MNVIKFGKGYAATVFDAVYTDESEKETLKDFLADFKSGADNLVPVAKITSSLLTVNKTNNTVSPLTTAKNTIPSNGKVDDTTWFEISGKNVSFKERCVVSYQGGSTVNDVKKSFAIDIESKHRIGDWLNMDSYHLKAYFGDCLRIKDVVSARLVEKMYQCNSFGKTRPFMLYNDFTKPYMTGLDMGALCHIDGFPVRLYVNDEYWGLYMFNIKKDRSNYMLNKSNKNHIMAETAEMTTLPNFQWNTMEFRNPKGLVDMDGNAYDGDNPKELIDETSAAYDEKKAAHVLTASVKQSWMAFCTNLGTITTSTSKEQLSEFMNVDAFVDAILFCQLIGHWDYWHHNTQYTTWDGVHWSPMIYDMDFTYGRRSDGRDMPTNESVFNYRVRQYAPYVITLETILMDECKSRWAELRNEKVFDRLTIMGLFKDLTRTIGQQEYEKEYERWPQTNFNYSLDFIDNWIKERLVWLDGRYGYNQ